jgi:uncharacterized protein YbbC (DUF1343 family)
VQKIKPMRVILIVAGFCISLAGQLTAAPVDPALSTVTSMTPTSAASAATILTGAQQMDLYLPLLKGKSVAIFANQTSVVGNRHLVDTLLQLGIRIRKIFSPEHGFRGDADAGEHVNSLTDPATGIPIISLYGSKNKPSPADLEDVDVLLFDIQDVGVRFYTYISSLQRYIESAIDNHRQLIIPDRPDPNGFYIDGPVLDPKFHSFVGMQPVPIVYGMTIGEYARMLTGEKWLDSSVTKHMDDGQWSMTVIPCLNYTHKSRYTLPVKPSPNLPNIQSVHLYPSLCLFEGTAISLGRGTEKAFQQFGHPAFPNTLYSFTPTSMAGAKTPPLQDKRCYGYDLSGVDVTKETGNRWSLKWLLQAYSLFPDKDHFFNGNGSGFDRLAGTDRLRKQIRDGATEKQIRKSWEPALTQFKKIRKKYLLYAD